MTGVSLTESVHVQAPASRVWRALTTASELTEWYAPGCRWEITSLAPGGIVRFFNTETDVQTATVHEAVPPSRLALAWRFDADSAPLTLLNTFTLEGDGQTTNVTISQSGYDALPDTTRDQWLAQDRGALAAIAASLKAHVERRRD